MRSRNRELVYCITPCVITYTMLITEITEIEAIGPPKILYFVTVFEMKSKFRYKQY